MEESKVMSLLEDISERMMAGFEAMGLEFQKIDGEWTAKRKQKTSRTTKEITYTPDFLKMKAVYPKRKNGISWSETNSQWMARVKEGEYTEVMIKGAEAYAKCMASEGKVGTNLVMEPKRFFGVHKHYLRNWVEGSDQPMTKEEKNERLEEIKKQKWAVIPATLNPMELTVWANDHQYEPLKNIRPGSAGLEDIREWKITTSKVIKQRIAESLRG